MDLEITNRAKDCFIEQLKKERENFEVEKLMNFSQKVGRLERNVCSLAKGENDRIGSREVPNVSRAFTLCNRVAGGGQIHPYKFFMAR